MKKFVILLLATAVLFTTRSYSQSNIRGSVKGVLIDSSEGHQPMANATISVTPLAGDSTDAEYTVSDKKGAFSMRGIRRGQYRLLITYEGYQPIDKHFSISDSGSAIDFGTLYLQRADKMLAAVVIQRPPMAVRHDSLEYNAGSFAVKPNAVAEDLLNKLPGITVD